MECWFGANRTLIRESSSVPENNKFSESIFGQVDQMLRSKPNIHTIAMEAHIISCHNETNDWLMQKTDKDQEKLIRDAMLNVKTLKKKSKQNRKKSENTDRGCNISKDSRSRE